LVLANKIRTFVAIELPENIRFDIRKLQHAFTSFRFEIRWVKPLNMHLTIKFLGDVDPVDLDTIGKVLSDIAGKFPSFDLIPRGLGVFPSLKRPRNLWIGIAGQTDVLGSIQQSVNSGLNEIGFTTEKRPFRGHLTFGRIKSRIDQDRLLEAFHAQQKFVSKSFTVENLVMFKSELTPDGPIYTKLYEMPLGILTTHNANAS
jgi:2'-5' RNA ligase